MKKEQMPGGQNSRPELFVKWCIGKMASQPGFAAEMRRADMPGRRFRALTQLAAFNIDFDRKWETAAYAAAAAGLARTRAQTDGSLDMGQAFRARAAGSGSDPESCDTKLRRLLFSRTPDEFLRILHRTADWIESGGVRISWAKTIRDIQDFGKPWSRRNAGLRWIAGLYGRAAEDLEAELAEEPDAEPEAASVEVQA